MTITNARPRLFLTPPHLARLKRTTSSARWQNLVAVCNANWDSQSEWQVSAPNYALVYQVTRDLRYADKAISWAQHFIDQGNAALLTPGQREGYICRSLCPQVAIAYDWCYDQLTPAQRTQWQNVMIGWHDKIWGDTTRWSYANPGDNFFHGYLMTGLLGYAIAVDHPRGVTIAQVIRDKWQARVKPYLARYGGYCSLEGTNYGSWVRHWLLMAAHLTATGESDFDDLNFTFPAESVLGRIHLTSPTMQYMAPLGEQTRVKEAPVSDESQAIMLMATSYANGLTPRFARQWLDRLEQFGAVPFQTNWRWTAWEDALWYNGELDLTGLNLPLSLYDPKSGFWSTRSSWEKDATWTVGTCGPTRESHQDRGAGQVYLWAAGGWLTAPARIFGGNGLLADTLHLNALLVGGADQPFPNADSPAQIAAKESPSITQSRETDTYSYVAMEGSGAYAAYKWPAMTNPCASWTREVLWLKPGVWLIRDTVQPTDPTKPVKRLFQSKDEPEIGAAGFVLKNGTQRLYASTEVVEATKTLMPESGTWRVEVPTAGGVVYTLLSLKPSDVLVAIDAKARLDEITNPTPPPPTPSISGTLTGILIVDEQPRPITITLEG